MIKVLAVIFLFFFIAGPAWAQSVINFSVKDKGEKPLSGVTVSVYSGTLLKKHQTDQLGKFRLSQSIDSIVFTLVGYQKKVMVSDNISGKKNIPIYLNSNVRILEEVVIIPHNINEEFSVAKINRLEIYNNPNASGDPLKAITFLPASTNINESATPSLRGSSPLRTAVVLNGVPIKNPVRNNQLNGIGNFSLFNPEMIGNLKVYASNPPITIGNSSAGMVEMETASKLSFGEYQVSTSLANIGAFANKPLKKGSFMQAYTNIQFSDLFLKLNGDNFADLKKFSSQDLGLNIHHQINKKSYINLYNYFIRENYKIESEMFSYRDDIDFKKMRDFTIVNYLMRDSSGQVGINLGTDFSRTDYGFSNTDLNTNQSDVFAAVNYQKKITSSLELQSGLNYVSSKTKFIGREPLYYYSLHPNAPTKQTDTVSKIQHLDPYLYLRYKPIKKVILGLGGRYRFDDTQEKNKLSFQGNIKFEVSTKQSLLLSAGTYHQFSAAEIVGKNIVSLKSKQLSLDYSYKGEALKGSLAGFVKKEESLEILKSDIPNVVEKSIQGIEFYLQGNLKEHFEWSVANTFLNVSDTYAGMKFRSENDMDYIVKTRLTFNRPTLLTASLAFIYRPGTYYTPIVSGIFSPVANAYEPSYGLYNSSQLNTYSSLDLSLNKMFSLGSNSCVLYANVTNLLNRNNRRQANYNTDYSMVDFGLFQKRSIYFGLVFYFGK